MSQSYYIVVPSVNNVFDLKLGHPHFNSVQANRLALDLSKKFKNLYTVWEITPKINHKVMITQCLNGEVLPMNEWQ